MTWPKMGTMPKITCGAAIFASSTPGQCETPGRGNMRHQGEAVGGARIHVVATLASVRSSTSTPSEERSAYVEQE